MSVFKAYDIRGRTPAEITPDLARRIGLRLPDLLGLTPGHASEGERAGVHGDPADAVVIGRDMRDTSPALEEALVAGLNERGTDAWLLGLCDTPRVTWATAEWQAAGGVMITASHNPAGWNGFKICREEGVPVGGETGLLRLERLCADVDDPADHGLDRDGPEGGATDRSAADGYLEHVLSFAGRMPDGVRLKVALDAGNGAAGPLLEEMVRRLPIEPVLLYTDPDGTFPNHEADPLKDENLQDLARAVRDGECAFGAAFDGDGDRCCVVDEHGERIGGDLFTAILARGFLADDPGSTVIHDVRCSRVVAEEVERLGGTCVRERVGHAFMKARMRMEGAVLGGEISGHTYFRENHYADTGAGAFAAFTAEAARAAAEGRTVSDLVAPRRRTSVTGEINFPVADADAALERVAETFKDAEQDHLDGLTVWLDGWWFNLRKSNTEPKLRLNLEADDADTRDAGLERVKGILGSNPVA